MILFEIKTVSGDSVAIAPSEIEAMRKNDWGTSLFMRSGLRWDTSEDRASLLERMVKWADGGGQ